MQCPKCQRSSVVEIVLKIADRPMTMRNCSRCDSRWWHSQGEQVALPRVLELAAQR